MDYSSLLIQINHYIMDYLNFKIDERFTYHNAEHAQYVATAALRISKDDGLDQEDLFILTVAAWFHDIGYAEGPEHHELRGSEMTIEYLVGLKVPDPVIDRIAKLILATQITYQPQDKLEEILRDADLFHLGTASFEKKNEQLHREQEFLQNKLISKKVWFSDSLKFLQSHKYHTEFCRRRSTMMEQKNIRLLQNRLKEVDAAGTEDDLLKSAERSQAGNVTRGINTFFQIASSNNQQLSNMADNKANILITVNSIIISAIVSFYLRKLADNDYLYIPAFLILGTGLSSMICAILATRPKVSRGTFNQKELNLRQVNLLFFGNFYKMKIEKYTEGILMMVNDLDYLQNSLIKDVYFQGVILGRKYFLLRLAYSIFMLGIILAVLAFLIVFILRGHEPKIKTNLQS